MDQTTFRFTFQPAEESQREMIHSWLKQDYIAEWIHGKGLQNTHAGLDKFFQYRTHGKGLDRLTDITQHWIGYDGEKPFVYLLTTNVFKNANDEYSKYSEEEGLAITLDIFIGDPNYVGKGLATQVISEFLLTHFSDVAEVFIDPEQSNERAVHVYQKAGFRIVGQFIASWHPQPHHIMKLRMRDLK